MPSVRALPISSVAWLERASSGTTRNWSDRPAIPRIGDFFVLLHSDGARNMFGPLGYGDDLDSTVK